MQRNDFASAMTLPDAVSPAATKSAHSKSTAPTRNNGTRSLSMRLCATRDRIRFMANSSLASTGPGCIYDSPKSPATLAPRPPAIPVAAKSIRHARFAQRFNMMREVGFARVMEQRQTVFGDAEAWNAFFHLFDFHGCVCGVSELGMAGGNERVLNPVRGADAAQ